MVRAAIPFGLLGAALLGLVPAPALARDAVDASAPSALSVTMYRDPNRGPDQQMNRNWPRGFAMITETRTVTLPPGESTIRFTGVAEGMIAVSAIVTGLPGGTIEKNRNADLLSPASLIDGTLGNRVTVTRTNPATGRAEAQDAIIRTRADGGLVLQTDQGFEAVRCSGLPEKLTFDRVPPGLAAQPVFSVDTRDAGGGTYTVQLTYLAWGFDWQAHYVASLADPGKDDAVRMRLTSWLTLLNDNGQSFEDAELLVIAGTLNVVSNFQGLADPPDARPLRLTCYPFGSTAEGTPIEELYPEPPPPPPPPMAPPPPPAPAPVMAQDAIVLTAARAPMKAEEEQLGDLKLYRVPEHVTVSAKGLKQIAFLDEDKVEGRMLYQTICSPWNNGNSASSAGMLLLTVNDKAHGLGAAMPMGAITFFEASPQGELFVGEQRLRDYAEGQDIEILLGQSTQVFGQCSVVDGGDTRSGSVPLKLVLTNANANPAKVRVNLGPAGYWRYRGLRDVVVKDGQQVTEVTVPGNGRLELDWVARDVGAPD